MLAYASAAFESSSTAVGGAASLLPHQPQPTTLGPCDSAEKSRDQVLRFDKLKSNIYHDILDQEYAQDVLEWLLHVEVGSRRT